MCLEMMIGIPISLLTNIRSKDHDENSRGGGVVHVWSVYYGSYFILVL